MKKKTKYILLFVLSFILYGNTLFHDYALDDALVITENEYTLSGFEGIDDLFSEEFFSGFFDEKNKKLVAGGRYRPMSMVTYAIEWQIIMGLPFKGINKITLKKRMNRNANPNYILPSQKLLKDLSKTLQTENRNLRNQQQESILNSTNKLNDQEKAVIRSNIERMHSKRSLLLFISHFVNVLLFAITTIILFILLERLLPDYRSDKWYLSLPLVVSLLFLVHPIHTEVVANIKGRDEILSLLGALLAALFALKYIDKQKLYFILLSFAAFLFALFSKEVAITFFAIIPLSIYFFSQKEKKTKYIIISIIPLFIASVFYFYVRNNVIGGMSFESGQELMNNSFLGMTFSEKYATIFYTLLLYLKLLIFPHPLTYDYYPYHIQVMSWSNLWPVISFVIYVFLGIYAILGFKKKQIVSFGILFYLITLSPMSNILFPIGVFMNERFVFAASIGIILIIAYFISNTLFNRINNANVIQYILFTILILFSVKTISRNRVWKNDFTLFTNDVKVSVNSAKSNTAAGGILIEEAIKPGNQIKKQEYLNQAVNYLRRAIKIHPRYNDALLLMGNAQWELYQNIDSTFKYYKMILERIPEYSRVYTNIFETKVNMVFEDKNRALQNVDLLHQLEKYNPDHFSINYLLGRIYGRYLNDLEASTNYLEKASKIDSKNIAVFKDLGVAYGMTQNFEKSAEALLKAVELDPGDPVLRINLAMTYANLKDFSNALIYMDNVLQMDINKKDASVIVNLGYLYKNMGYEKKAQQCFIKAQKLNPELFRK
ncbi:MAG: hypothetical protein KOO66_08650 [Bacteroidales bacterium]|nr:hypothetical protein [Bacteroidales bacterium]